MKEHATYFDHETGQFKVIVKDPETSYWYNLTIADDEATALEVSDAMNAKARRESREG